MGIIRKVKNRPTDTFPACHLHGLRGTPKLDEFVEYRIRTGCGLGTAQSRRKGRMEL